MIGAGIDSDGWIVGNEPVPAFDYDGNGRIEFAGIVRLFIYL